MLVLLSTIPIVLLFPHIIFILLQQCTDNQQCWIICWIDWEVPYICVAAFFSCWRRSNDLSLHFQLKVNDFNPHKFVKPNIARSQLAQVQYQSLYSYNSAHTLNIFSTYSSIYSYNSAHILNIFPIYSSIYFYNSAYTFKPTFFHTLSSSQPRWPRLKWLWGPFTLGPFYSPGTKSLLPICASLCTTQASLKGFSKQRIHCSWL